MKIWMVIFIIFLYFPVFAKEHLIFAIHPYLSATELIDRFSPLVESLERTLDVSITISISRDYQHHIDRVGKDEVDFAYIGPSVYVNLVKQWGKKPLLARLEINHSPYFKGAIITSQTNIKKLSDLSDKNIAFGDPLSTMSYIVPNYMLHKAGVKNFTSHFLYSHKNVALAVLMGQYEAGAVKEEVFFAYQKRGLQVLAWSPEISEHLFVTSNTLPQATCMALKSALLQQKTNVLKKIKNTATGLVEVHDQDYDSLREIMQFYEN